ncbi:hypothetical protein GQ53DRAFT_747412 [Thozetella sp. PMI_491]|nr:hypothetical protein GQ53DRAFT_747412 [Thozetella sp. PMI_491]
MDSEGSYSPTLPATPSIIMEDIQILDQTSQSTSQPTSQPTSYKDLKYNKTDFILIDKDIYIFKNGLFTRDLQPIDYNKEREVLIKCTIYSYKKIDKVNGFQSSNYVRHYKYKHPNIAYNKESENTKLIKANLPPKKGLFNQLESRKRIRSATI